MDFSNDTNTIGNISTLTPASGVLTVSGTGALVLPTGTTAQQPGSPAAGSIRLNTTTSTLEYYSGSAWVASSVSTLAALTDVTITSPTSGQFLLYNGTKWVNTTTLTNLTVSSNISAGTLNVSGYITGNSHLLLGDSLNNANIANAWVSGTPSGLTGDRPINFIDTSAVMKIVRIGGNPGLELQEWDSTITTNIGYWDMVSVSGQYQLRDRSNPVSTLVVMTADKTTGAVVIPSTLTASSVNTTVATKTANYTLVDTDSVILVNGAYTMTLPAAATAGSGTQFVIKRIGTQLVTIASNGGTIDGNATVQLTTQYTSVNIVSDGSNWWII